MSRPRAKARNSEAVVRARCEANVKLIYHVANRLARRCHRDADELISYGFLGLHRAAEMFDETLGFEFSTYAVPKITGCILDGVRDEAPWSVRLERDRCAYHRAAIEAEAAGEVLDDEAAAERLGWSVERVLRARTLAEPRPGDPMWLNELLEAGNQPL